MKHVRIVGFVEAISFLVLLLVAMPMKYVWGMPEAVKITGSLHGGLFVVYVALATYFAAKAEWPARKLMLAYIAAVVPCGPFIFDKRLFS